MKRTLALFLSAALLLALLGACTGSNDPITTVIPSDSAGESATVPPESTPSPEPSEQPSEEPTEEATAEPSEEPSQTPETQAPATQTPATQTPATQPPATQPPVTQPPAPSPTLPGGGIVLPGPGGNTEEPTDKPSDDPDGFANPTGPSASDVNLTSFYQTVLSSYGFPPMEVLPNSFAANYYPGLFTIPVVQRIVGAPAMTGVAAELTLVQVTNSSDVSAVKSILQARVDRQVASGAFYPLVVEAWQNNSRIVSKGNYVMLVVHSECDAIVDQFNAFV